jgi:hypothetical protein
VEELKQEMESASKHAEQMQAVMKKILLTFAEQTEGVQAIACAAKEAIAMEVKSTL